ncbi:MAG TPA: DUF1559 domain-containing protein [Pirellulaceae bacterium]|nr:DUF1559 domain-containing protein [Pirellulaceae bacterium]
MLAPRTIQSFYKFAIAFLCMPLLAVDGMPQTINKFDHPVARLAPETCYFYSGWNHGFEFDISSTNPAERLLAEPDVRRFVDSVIEAVGRFAPQMMDSAPPEKQAAFARTFPSILEALLKRAGCLYLEHIQFGDDEQPPTISGALWLDVGERAAVIAEDLATIFASENRELQTTEIAGRTFFVIETQESSNPEFLVGSVDSYLTIALGQQQLGAAIRRMAANNPPEWLAELLQRQPLKRVNTVGYVDVNRIRELLLPIGGPEAAAIVSALGLDSLEAIESSAGFSEKEAVSRVFLRFSRLPQGIFSLFADEGIVASQLGHLPADSMFAVAVSLDPQKVLAYTYELLERFAPYGSSELDDTLNSIREETGIDVKQDILANLGSTWTLFNGAADGWLTGLALTVDVQNSDGLSRALSRFAEILAAEFEGSSFSPKFQQREEGIYKVYTLNFSTVGAPFEPSWTLTEDKLIITLFPAMIKTMVGGMEFEKLVTDENFGDFVRANRVSRMDEQFIGLTYIDTAKQFEFMYLYGQMIFSMGSGFASEFALDDGGSVADFLRSIDLPPARVIHRHLAPSVSTVRRSERGIEIESYTTFPAIDTSFLAPVAIALILPAVQQVRTAAHRTTSMNNLRQLAIAAFNFESAYRRFPAAYSTDADGNRLLSWRVHLLPFVEQEALYREFRLDEPWDSEHNLALLERMPDIFRSPRSEADPGMTVYLGVGGEQGVLIAPSANRADTGIRLADITDGLSNTLMLVEVNDTLAVPWTKPDDGINTDSLELETLEHFFGLYPNGTNVAFCDGSTRFLSSHLRLDLWIHLLKRNDGHVIDYWELDR